MLKIHGNDIVRDGKKIGWIQGNHLYDHTGKKLAYINSNDIHKVSGHKVGYLEGASIIDHISGTKISTERNNKYVKGGNLTDLERAAVRLIFEE